MAINPVLLVAFRAKDIRRNARLARAAIVDAHLMQFVTVAVAFIPATYNVPSAMRVKVNDDLAIAHVPTLISRAGTRG